MKKRYVKSWKTSVQPRKQRKYRHNAPLHEKSSMLNSNLSEELRKKYGKRSLRVKIGDKVKIMRGSFRKKEGKVEEVDVKNLKVYVSKIETQKRDGSKSRVPMDPSNLQITELNMDDKNRKKKLESKGAN